MSPDEVDEVFALIQDSFGEEWPRLFAISVSPREHLQWKMSSPNAVPDNTTVIEIGGHLIGYWGRVERDVWVQGRRLPGGIGGDRLVHPDFQGLGLSSAHRDWLRAERPSIMQAVTFGEGSSHPRLARSSKRRGESVPLANKVDELLLPIDVAAIARNTPQKLSRPSVVRRLRMRSKMLVTRMRWRSFSTPAPALAVRNVERFDECANTLWNQVRDTLDFAVVRDQHYLNWRYCDPRAGIYRVRAVEKEGELLGFMVTTSRGKTTQIVDLMTIPGDEGVLRALIEDAVAGALDDGANSVSVLMPRMHPYREIFRRSGFIVSWNRNLTHNTWSDAPLGFLGTDRHARVHITFGDSDTV